MKQRLALDVRGVVQGVGFRPHVFGLATRLRLAGFVRNQSGKVWIEVEGEAAAIARFRIELMQCLPPLARIDELNSEVRPLCGESAFHIADSVNDPSEAVFISPDVAACDDCLRELFDPADRRFRYPFLNCTNCGPRLTIITGAPYDRGRTTMAGFPMCPACQAEYDDPLNRRFHAQPIACSACGPRLRLLDVRGQPIDTTEPLARFAEAIRAGRIGAMKGLGGYHLVCDARNEGTVRELRSRKHRDEKPLAVMVESIDVAEQLCLIDDSERDLLLSSRRPIVLLRKRPAIDLAESIAPGNPFLGVMLPYTPLHHLLMRALDGLRLVMTSGNRSDEPIAYEDADAILRLAGIADLFLTHDRPIHVRCDDSVTRVIGGVELPLRRSRGYAPLPIPLPGECSRPVLAVGGQLKGTFALGRGRHAVVSHHLGDLDQIEAFQAFERDIELFQRLFAFRPEIVAHDMHPDSASTRYALQRHGVKLIAVQHHHAHMASCMAEHRLSGPVIGVTLDGTGFGTDGTIWGGEFLVGDYAGFGRAAHLRTVGMPGGEKAIREPWRMALAYLRDADCEWPMHGISACESRVVRSMLDAGVNCPVTSSAGRLFDAVAAIAGVRQRVNYEGQAAVELEWLATDTPSDAGYPFEIVSGSPLVVDTRPLIRAVSQDAKLGLSQRMIARRFHTTLVNMIAAVCARVRDDGGPNEVVLSGGVFLNALLTREVQKRLTSDGFAVYRHTLVPPNDGGLSLGQIAVAMARPSTFSNAFQL